jgi:carboxylate-amine ligase
VREAAAEVSPEDSGLGAVVAHAVGITMRGTSGMTEVDEVPDLLRVRQV